MKKLDAVLYLHHGLGDLVMALPLLDDLRSAGARCDRILVFVRCASTFRLLEVLGYTRDFEVRIFKRRIALLYPLWLSMRRPRVILAPQSCGDWRMPLLCRLTFCKSSIGPQTTTRSLRFSRTIQDHDMLREHKVDYYRRFAELAGFTSAQLSERRPVELPEALRTAGVHLLDSLAPDGVRWLGFAPGSGAAEAHKRWPAAHFSALADILAAEDSRWRFALLGSAAEAPLLEQIRGMMENPDRAYVVTPADIGIILSVYRACECLVTGCNGPSHMAGLLGTPLVSIYGPTNEGNTGAWSPRRRVLRADLSCAPCYRLDFLHGCEAPVCMSLITPRQVADAVSGLLDEGGCDPLKWHDNSYATAPANSVTQKTKTTTI